MKKSVICPVFIAIIAIIVIGIIGTFIYHYLCISNWTSNALSFCNIMLTFCNVMLFGILTSKLIELTDETGNKQRHLQKSIAKMELSHTVFVELCKNLNDSYKMLQENSSKENQQVYDTFKNTFIKNIKELGTINPEIYNLDSYKWWKGNFNDIDKHFTENSYYDFNEHSQVSSPKLQELLREIHDKIYGD